MQIFDPTRPSPVFHGGSFNGNPVSCAAGRATLEHLTSERIAAMDAASERIRASLAHRAAQIGIEIVVSGLGSVAGIAFVADPRRHEDDPSALGLASLFHLAAANEGVLIGPGGVMAVSTAHDAPAVDHVIASLSSALDQVAGLLKSGQLAEAKSLKT